MFIIEGGGRESMDASEGGRVGRREAGRESTDGSGYIHVSLSVYTSVSMCDLRMCVCTHGHVRTSSATRVHIWCAANAV